MPEDLNPTEFKVGNLITLNQDMYPALGTLFVQIWEGDDVVARVYGDTRKTLNRRLAALGFGDVKCTKITKT